MTENSQSSSTKDEYYLERNLASSGRLNFQFFLWKDTFSFNIHPSIPIPSNAVIADIATGTGIWLLDVARDKPRAELHGFDITLEQAPRKEWLPKNVTLRTWNVFDDVPEDTIGKFDMIHVRLLGLNIRDGDTGPVFRNVLKMLKPGGHFQWDELDEAHASVKTVNPDVKAPAWNKLMELSNYTVKYAWPSQLAESAKEAGFEHARLYRFEDRREMGRAHMEMSMLFFQEFASRLETTGQKEEAVKYQSLLKTAAQEILQGSISSIPKVVCVARKPVDKTVPDEDPVYYLQDIPPLVPVIKDLYKDWSGLDGDILTDRLYKIRERAWKIAQYPCIGRFQFTRPSITLIPMYRSIVARARNTGVTVIDVGCCFGQNLRVLAAEGVSTENMYATDIKSELWELGFELFGDRDKMKAKFIQADICGLDTGSELHQLNGKMNIIIAYFFVHLFDWDNQVIALKRFVELSRVGSMVMGRSIARTQARIIRRPWCSNVFVHDVNTFREIWRLVGMETGTVWSLNVVLAERGDSGYRTVTMDVIDFVATREM